MSNRRAATNNRPERVPLHEQRNKLTVSNRDPNFVYRWVNDSDERIAKFKAAGYEAVTHETQVGDPAVESGQNKTGSVVTKHVGGKTTAVLMRIPKEWYEEDQRTKQEELNASEAAMQREALSQFSGVKGGRARLDINSKRGQFTEET